jgi:hypothetical protein
LAIAGVLGVAAVAGLVVAGIKLGRGPAGTRPGAVAFDARTPLPVLVPALRDSDARALTALYQRISEKPDARPPALSDEEAPAWLDALAALRAGYVRFGGYGRSTVLNITAKVMYRFSIEEAPAAWSKVLTPARDLFASGLADPDPSVRVAALTELGRLWSWVPGRTPMKSEEDALAEWKGALYRDVEHCLADRLPKVRTAAVACLGLVPIDELAAAAIPYLQDMSKDAADVRRQVLISFAARRGLLTEDALLKCHYDPDPTIPELADTILKTRGLNAEQISLGQMIFHPKAELRASVIPLLRDRTDIDPVVWLLQLSHDSDPTVRAGAVGALASRLSPEVRRRLGEMATSDQSEAVREAAGKIVPPKTEKTAALPPLPGSPSLNPKAN